MALKQGKQVCFSQNLVQPEGSVLCEYFVQHQSIGRKIGHLTPITCPQQQQFLFNVQQNHNRLTMLPCNLQTHLTFEENVYFGKKVAKFLLVLLGWARKKTLFVEIVQHSFANDIS